MRSGEAIEAEMSNFVHAPGSPYNGFNTDENDTISVLNEDEPVLKIPFDTKFGLFKRNLITSYNGEYLYFENENVIYRASKDGETVQVLDTEEVFGRKIEMGIPSLGADRYLYFVDADFYNDGVKTGFMYDLEEGKALFSRSNGYYQETYKTLQTLDGGYLIEHRSYAVLISRLSNGIVESTKTFSKSYHDVFIDYAHDNRIILIEKNGMITLYNPIYESFEYHQVNLSPNSANGDLSYDPVTGYVGIPIDNQFYVFNPRNGSILRKIGIVQSSSPFNLYNRYIYWNHHRLDLNL